MASTASFSEPVVMGTEALMSPKAHGTCEKPPPKDLRFKVDHAQADRICCFNRHYAERSGYWKTTSFLDDVKKWKKANGDAPMEFYDTVSGDLLFKAPVGRSWDSFLKESTAHGWPSFRDNEVEWKNMRVLPGGESVSLAGTHLGHNLPDRSGNRYCINLVSVAGKK